MAENIKRQIEKLEADYDKIASKDVWEPCHITLMKDLQKLMYYIEVRQAMKQGGEYPGSEYMDDDEEMSRRSYARGRDRMGRYTSGMRGRSYNMDGGPWYYDDGRGSGRRSYDDGKEEAMHKMRKMMETETNPEIKMAIQEGIRFLESK